MQPSRLLTPSLLLLALMIAGCATDPQGLVADREARAQAIEALVADPAARGEVVDRLLRDPDSLFGRIVEDEQVVGALVDRLMQSERGKATAATRIASDSESTRTFIGMMMLTGGVGEIMNEKQADYCLRLGDVLAHGNQRRTMVDLKRLGTVVDEWAASHAGTHPVCDGLGAVTDCLAANLPEGALADLRLSDAWGRPIRYRSAAEGSTYALVSYAADGKLDELRSTGPTGSYDADIVFTDGGFVKWPGRISKDSIQ